MKPKAEKYGWVYYFSKKYRHQMKLREARIKRPSNSKIKVYRKKLIARDGTLCKFCFQYMPIKDRTIDHIIKLSDGGTNSMENLRLMHRSCHTAHHKGEKAPLKVKIKLPSVYSE
jgi:5-methylcytosine-specific restriction endonuclease McrA